MTENLVVIRTLADLSQLHSNICDKDIIAFDIETTGTDISSEIIGISFCAELGTAYYVVLSYWDVTSQSLISLETKQGIKDILLKLQGKSLIAHNAIFDASLIEKSYGVSLMPYVWVDTMILAHLLDENRRVGLKELALSIWGEESTLEQREMKESVTKNGGVLNKTLYELYKADSELIARYGAKDTILTLKLLYHLLPQLEEQGLEDFFFKDESMPILRGPTYDLNTVGLKVDVDRLQKLKVELETECLEAEAFIRREIADKIKDKYPGTSKVKTFNINAPQQMSWLVFCKYEMEFGVLTDGGRDLCHALELRLPYAPKDKREFIRRVTELKDHIYAPASINPKTGKLGRPKKVGDPWVYMACGKDSLKKTAQRYKWAEVFLEYKQKQKLLNTYVSGIQERMKYGIIRPSFLQHGTTSGRYSSRNPNFQNLPRGDKRIKACIVARPGNVLVAADQAQLEPRVFASFSKDERLLKCFKDGEDFYSVVGAPVFGIYGCSLKKDGTPESFPVKYAQERDVAKVFALAAPYGTTAPQMSNEFLKKANKTVSIAEAQEMIDTYFESYPNVHKLMLESHKTIIEKGVICNLFGRPRRVPEAMSIPRLYGKTPHAELPRAARTLLNLAMNHPIQSTGASIMNRASIALYEACKELGKTDPLWTSVKIVLQVHDELVLEGPEALKDDMAALLKHYMEHTVELPGVDLIAEPKIGYNLSELK